MKLGVCIPYRDIGDGVRKEHLDTLVPHLEKFLGERNIDFTCYVGHQVDDMKFSRSGTKNVAYLEAKKDGCDYFAFHDVDMLPEDGCDYSHPGDTPKHISTFLSQWNYTLRDIEYFGGVVMFTGEQFENINGYHMDYWGWGMEDDDLFWRCVRKGYYKEEEVQEIKQKMVLVLDGKTTYIEIPSTRKLQSVPQDSFEIEIICKGEIPEHEDEYLIGDEDIQYVKYPIISKRGYDFGIDFNNSNAYASSMWDFKNKHYYQWVKRYQDKWTKVNLKSDTDKNQILFTINDKVLDGQFGIQKSKIRYRDRLKRYGRVPFYIGCNSPQSWGGQRFFKGEIAEIKIKNQYDELLLHYDMTKSICCDQDCKKCKENMEKDLSGNDNHGIIHGRSTKFYNAPGRESISVKSTVVPDRRYGRMLCMEHEDEGIVNNKFQGDPEQTSKNEVIYRRKMQKDLIDIDKDSGLKQMKYTIDSIDTIYNRHKLINVRF